MGWGNQNYAVFETLGGYTVVKDPLTGYYQYAKLSADKNYLEPGGVRVKQTDPENLGLKKHIRAPKDAAVRMTRMAFRPMGSKSRWEERRERVRSAKQIAMRAPGISSAPPKEEKKGKYKGLCLLIQFPDEPGSIPQSEVEDFCNKVGYSGYENNGSVFDYYNDISAGKLKYTNIVTPYYTARNPKDYYTDPKIPQPDRAVELIEEALADLMKKGFDFSRLSTDNEGYIYALNIFYAGFRANNWGEGLWPHSYHLNLPYDVGNGRKAYDYQISDMAYDLSLATFCHENGHMVCDFPDLYDYGRDDPSQVPKSYGIGVYCLMCSGGTDKKNPSQVCAYLKYKAGWAKKVTPITEGVYKAKAGKNDFFIRAKNPTEYFIIENRFQEGRDSSLPGSGLAIWHIDELASNDYEDMMPKRHYECSLEQADNLFELEQRVNRGDLGDLYNAETSTGFGDSTMPSSKWWDGNPSGLEIIEIDNSGKAMSFRSIGNRGKFVMSSSPNRKIPDDDENGVRDMISFGDEANAKLNAKVSTLKVVIDIAHPWIGDLRVSLISPSGTHAVLFDGSSEITSELKATFDTSSAPKLQRLVGEPIIGDWTLWVQDLAASEQGILKSWSLEVEGQ